MNSNPYIEALEADQDGNWHRAHKLVQDLTTTDAAWIHAYLHRKEGDAFNAGYWYNRAGKPGYEGSPEEEWQQLWKHFHQTYRE